MYGGLIIKELKSCFCTGRRIRVRYACLVMKGEGDE